MDWRIVERSLFGPARHMVSWRILAKMSTKLLTVADRFLITGRGVNVLPPVPEENLAGRKPGFWAFVSIRRPDGSEIVSKAWIGIVFADPRAIHIGCKLTDVGPDDVPAGSEIW